MRNLLLFVTLLLISGRGKSQSIDGVYTSYELIDFKIDSTGAVSFYEQDEFPKTKWFHEVKVTIKGTLIMIEKSPVEFDSAGVKVYSASDGGFLTYKGKVTKVGDIYISKMKLSEFDYIGIGKFSPAKFNIDEVDSVTDSLNLDKQKRAAQYDFSDWELTNGVNGSQVYLPKGTISKDYIIRTDTKRNGLWINNCFFRKFN